MTLSLTSISLGMPYLLWLALLLALMHVAYTGYTTVAYTGYTTRVYGLDRVQSAVTLVFVLGQLWSRGVGGGSAKVEPMQL
jgi:O-acetyl-ADP-ribose deacetylase (regulator of RNase III)